MHVRFRGVNDAFRGLVQTLNEADRGEGGCDVVRVDSRNGPVMRVVGPVTVSYDRPKERVLLNTARDASPFLTLYESLWMLAGREDVASLAYYAERMRDYSDDGETLNGAYGYRWRNAGGPYNDTCDIDQLKILVEHLLAKPESRRAVLQMWGVEDDLLKIDSSKDVCCNLCVLFSIRPRSELSFTHQPFVPEEKRGKPINPARLDMTVFNRSNDMIWGTLGNDFVCFSVLQEYIATHLGIEVGVYNQVSNDLHVYLEGNSGWRPAEWLKEYDSPETSTERWYTDDLTKTVPLVGDPEGFDQCISQFVQENWGDCQDLTDGTHWGEPFLDKIAQPMCHAFHMHKNRNYEASLHWIDRVEADDWREAGRNWLLRRQKNWEKSQNEAL